VQGGNGPIVWWGNGAVGKAVAYAWPPRDPSKGGLAFWPPSRGARSSPGRADLRPWRSGRGDRAHPTYSDQSGLVRDSESPASTGFATRAGCA